MTLLPNFLSFIRIPLGIAFWWVGGPLRLILSLGAAISDGLDGYLARRFKVTSKLGTLLDPLGDKFFALAVFGKLYLEGTLPPLLFLSLFSREGALLLFTIFLWFRGKWAGYQIKSFLMGKMMTTFQFTLLIALLLGLPIYNFYFIPFLLLGILSFVNLILDYKKI